MLFSGFWQAKLTFNSKAKIQLSRSLSKHKEKKVSLNSKIYSEKIKMTKILKVLHVTKFEKYPSIRTKNTTKYIFTLSEYGFSPRHTM